MKLNYYTIYDKVSDSYGERPFLAPNDATAMRSIKNTQRNDKQFNINADDYALYCVGSYDNTTGDMLTDKREVAKLTYINFENEVR